MAQHPRWTIYIADGEPIRQPGEKEAERFGFEATEVVPALTDEQRAWVEKRVKRAHPTDTVAASLADWLGS